MSEINFDGKPGEYSYSKTEHGLVAEGIVKNGPQSNRNPALQSKIAHEQGEKGDHGGHLIPQSQGGRNDETNIVAQNGNVNQRDVRSVERNNSKLADDPNNTVYVKVSAYTREGQTRPDCFMITSAVKNNATGNVDVQHSSFTNASHKEQQEWNDIVDKDDDIDPRQDIGLTPEQRALANEYANAAENIPDKLGTGTHYSMTNTEKTASTNEDKTSPQHPDTDKSVEPNPEDLADRQIGEMPDQHVDETPDLQVDEMPDPHVDEMPDPHVDEMPDIHADEMPDAHVDEMPDIHLDEMPDIHVDEMANPHIDEMPDIHVDEMPNPHIDEMPDIHVDEMPNPHIDEMPDIHADEMPDTHIDEMPDLHVDEMPESFTDIDAALDGFINGFSETPTEESEVSLIETSDAFMGEDSHGFDAHIGQNDGFLGQNDGFLGQDDGFMDQGDGFMSDSDGFLDEDGGDGEGSDGGMSMAEGGEGRDGGDYAGESL